MFVVNGLVASSFFAFFSDFFAMVLFFQFFCRPQCSADAAYYASSMPNLVSGLNVTYILAVVADSRHAAVGARRSGCLDVDLINSR
jgi:hypothetical protein